ncbi:MAG: hypothetical protein RL701_1201 [Pseudomonadota bacterium]
MGRRIVPLLCIAFALSCATSDRDRAWVRHALAARGTQTAGANDLAARSRDGLDEDDAVATALARSPVYQADLARIDTARADLDEAQRPANPQLTLMAALGPISAFATLLAPLESLWQLPYRSAVAARALEAVASSLVQSGLDLARDARLAHSARALAEDRVRIRRDLARISEQLNTLAQQRLDVGEAAPAESAAMRAEAALARDAHAISVSEREIARAELRAVLGLERDAPRFELAFRRSPVVPTALEPLLRAARHARPDLCAAEFALTAALARAGWEHARIVAVAAQLEGHWTKPDVLAARAGGRIELPLFGANPGGIGRAEAEISRARAQLSATRQRVVLEVMRARTSALQAQASLERYRNEVRPALQQALDSAEQSYALGEDSYTAVLDLARRSGEAQLREAELLAQTRRADAELERAVGGRMQIGTSL